MSACVPGAMPDTADVERYSEMSAPWDWLSYTKPGTFIDKIFTVLFWVRQMIMFSV